MQKYFLPLSISFLLLQMTGCTSRSQNGSTNTDRANDANRQAYSSHVTLIDQQGLSKVIHERNGKFLLLNIWATWCQPCVEEFPDLIRLAQTDTLVEVVGVSVDYPDEIHSKVTPFLEKMNVPFKIYVAKFEKQEDFIAAIDSTWSGAVPATYIYDRKGRKQFSHIGLETFELFEKQIQAIRKN